MSVFAVNGQCQRGTRNAEREMGDRVLTNAATARIAVVVTCHAAYLPFLSETLASVDGQEQAAAERVLCLDGCDFTPPSGWRVIRGEWHNPNPGRNAGWLATTAPWVVFWDGDDVMPPGYLAALERELSSTRSNLGIVYPSLNRGSYDAPRGIDARTPNWSYWGQRHSLYIQSGAAWRRSALFQVGGWDDEAGVHDDGNLAARITALGWTAQRLAHPVVKLRAHDRGHRWMLPGRAEALWRFRTLTIVIPVVRPERQPTIMGTLAGLDVPDHCAVLIMDNTPGFQCEWMLPSFAPLPFEDFRIIRVPAQNRDHDRNGWARHQHIAAIYNRALRACTSDMIFTWEDDVRIPRDAIRLLWEHFQSGSDIGAASGVYESANCPGYVCGSPQFDHWSNSVPMDAAPAECQEWGFIPGGCTLWAGHALYPQLPLDPQFNGPGVEGWDAQLSRAIRAAGLRLLLDGRVRCEHEFV